MEALPVHGQPTQLEALPPPDTAAQFLALKRDILDDPLPPQEAIVELKKRSATLPLRDEAQLEINDLLTLATAKQTIQKAMKVFLGVLRLGIPRQCQKKLPEQKMNKVLRSVQIVSSCQEYRTYLESLCERVSKLVIFSHYAYNTLVKYRSLEENQYAIEAGTIQLCNTCLASLVADRAATIDPDLIEMIDYCASLYGGIKSLTETRITAAAPHVTLNLALTQYNPHPVVLFPIAAPMIHILQTNPDCLEAGLYYAIRA